MCIGHYIGPATLHENSGTGCKQLHLLEGGGGGPDQTLAKRKVHNGKRNNTQRFLKKENDYLSHR